MKKIRLDYRGFKGSIDYAAEDEVFYGKVLGVDDLITFEGDSVKALKSAFHQMVDEHIQDYEKEIETE